MFLHDVVLGGNHSRVERDILVAQFGDGSIIDSSDDEAEEEEEEERRRRRMHLL